MLIVKRAINHRNTSMCLNIAYIYYCSQVLCPDSTDVSKHNEVIMDML